MGCRKQVDVSPFEQKRNARRIHRVISGMKWRMSPICRYRTRASSSSSFTTTLLICVEKCTRSPPLMPVAAWRVLQLAMLEKHARHWQRGYRRNLTSRSGTVGWYGFRTESPDNADACCAVRGTSALAIEKIQNQFYQVRARKKHNACRVRK